MEDDFDIEELEIVLGLKNKEDLLKNVISDKKGLSFLGAISKIINYENLNDLYEKNEEDTNENEMISDFSLKMGINKISNISLKEYQNSNFINNIKGDDTLLHDSKINFSNEYVQKLQKDFKKESAEPMKPIQIKSNEIEKPKDYNNKYKKNKKNYYKNDNRKNYQEKDKNNEKNLKENENKNEEKVNEDNKEEKKEDIKEENKEDKKEDANFYEDEEEEGNNNESSYKKNETNNNYHNKRNYKFDRNKQHKAYRQNYNRKKFK